MNEAEMIDEAGQEEQIQQPAAPNASFLEEMRAEMEKRFAQIEQSLLLREESVQKRENALQEAALKEDLKERLQQHGLPGELAGMLNLASTANPEEIAKTLENAFREAVKQAVEQRLKGETPAENAIPEPEELSDEAYYYNYFNQN